MLTVKDIITQWLKEHNCDGLCDIDNECGCGLDDLMPCNNNCERCVPAEKVIYKDDIYYKPLKIGGQNNES